MIEDIVTQTVTGDGVIDIVGLVGHPVIAELFGAEYQYPQIAVLVIFDHRQSGKGFAEADAICQDTAVVLF